MCREQSIGMINGRIPEFCHQKFAKLVSLWPALIPTPPPNVQGSLPTVTDGLSINMPTLCPVSDCGSRWAIDSWLTKGSEMVLPRPGTDSSTSNVPRRPHRN